MMLTLSLLRHAKSSWGEPGLRDFDRPLNGRGRSAAPAVGRYMADAELRPDLVLCSTARRTRETLDFLLPFLSRDNRPVGTPSTDRIAANGPEIRFEDELYETHTMVGGLLGHVQALSDTFHHVLIVGHNPGLHALAVQLSGRGDPKLREQLAWKFPTATLAVIRFDMTAWSDIKPRLGELAHFAIAREIESDN